MFSILQKLRLYLIITHQQGGWEKVAEESPVCLLSASVSLKVMHGIANKTLLCTGWITHLFMLKQSESLWSHLVKINTYISRFYLQLSLGLQSAQLSEKKPFLLSESQQWYFFSSEMGSTFPKISSSNAGNSVTKKAVILAHLRSQVWEGQECWSGIQRKHFRNYSMDCNMVKERRG